jgi:HD superfamily phosphohydrolase YqeK
MNYSKSLLADFENIFSTYTDTFLTDNADFDKNILLKIEHSLLVQQECRWLAEAEKFSPRMATLIEICGLFHDIGRFEQLREFNTFVDCKSIDHGNLGREVMIKTKMLAALPEKDRNIILSATKNHNKRMLADGFDEETLLVVKAVRDADKLDIMRVLLNEYAKGKLDETVILHLEESDTISPKVLVHLEQGENPNIADFRTLTDFKLAQLAWIYDLNFKHSRCEFKKRKFYEQITNLLPDIPQVNKLCKQMLDYLNAAIISE